MVVVLLKCIFHAAYPLTSFEIQTHYQKEPKFNGVYSIIYPEQRMGLM